MQNIRAISLSPISILILSIQTGVATLSDIVKFSFIFSLRSGITHDSTGSPLQSEPASTFWQLHTDSNSLTLSLGHRAAPWAPAEPQHTGPGPTWQPYRVAPRRSPLGAGLSRPYRWSTSPAVAASGSSSYCCRSWARAAPRQQGAEWRCAGSSSCSCGGTAARSRVGWPRLPLPFLSFPFPLTPLPPRIDEQGEAGQHHQQVHVGGFVPGLVHRVVDGPAVAQRRRTASARPPGCCRHGLLGGGR